MFFILTKLIKTFLYLILWSELLNTALLNQDLLFIDAMAQSFDCNNISQEPCNTHHYANSDSQSGKHCPFHWGTPVVTVQSTPQRLPWGWVCPKCHCNPYLPRSSRHWQQTDITNVRTTQQLGTGYWHLLCLSVRASQNEAGQE